MMVLGEISDALLFYNLMGPPVKLNGLGTFTPSMSRDGSLNINVRLDVAIKNGINKPGDYHGVVLNRSRAGLDNAGLKELWDAERPEDPLAAAGGRLNGCWPGPILPHYFPSETRRKARLSFLNCG